MKLVRAAGPCTVPRSVSKDIKSRHGTMPLFAIVPLGALGMVRGPHTLTMRGVRLRA